MKVKMKSLGSLLLGICMLLLPVASVFTRPTQVNASEKKGEEIFYYKSDGDDTEYFGEGQEVNSDEYIYYDSQMTTVDKKIISGLPSYGNTNTALTDGCGPVAAANICGFYDRWYTNLIPNYSPGGAMGNGYVYFPPVNRVPVQTCINNLYTAMQTNVNGAGTSLQEFKDGLVQYAQGKGYGITYSSILQNSTTLNLSQIEWAVNNNKVVALFCRQYNFVFAINDLGNHVKLSKKDYNLGHIMVIYGYKTVKYYKNGVNFQTDTYLYAVSGYNSAAVGYVKLNGFMNMSEALIVSAQ